MASWSTRRKYGYFLAFAAVVLIVVGVPTFFALYQEPTCMDGKQNGGERGVDCGGECARLCPADFAKPKILWTYSMKIVPGVYNALAYIQNPNQLVESKVMPYVFRLYDKDGLLITDRAGQTFVPAGQKFAVFEGAIETGQRVPTKTTFEFSSEPSWRAGKILSDLRVENVLIEEEGSPRAEVTIKNISISARHADVDTFIVLYDAAGNRVAFSKTFLDSIGPESYKTLFFTWQEPFSKPVVRNEVLFVEKPLK